MQQEVEGKEYLRFFGKRFEKVWPIQEGNSTVFQTWWNSQQLGDWTRPRENHVSGLYENKTTAQNYAKGLCYLFPKQNWERAEVYTSEIDSVTLALQMQSWRAWKNEGPPIAAPVLT